MVKFISKSELDSKKSDNKTTHNTGEIYPQIFSYDNILEFKDNIQITAGIIWLGGYKIDSNLFPKEKCPICGKEEVLVPYKVIGSVLSGCHTIQFYCKECHERFVTNDYIEYFRLISRYIMTYRSEFKPEQCLNNCTSLPINAKLV